MENKNLLTNWTIIMVRLPQ